MPRRSFTLVLLAALILAGLHWSFRAHQVGQWDVVNYCLGVQSFDPLQHRPHPPGYVFYIAVGKALAALLGNTHTALIVLSCACSGLAAIAILLLARLFVSPTLACWITLAACTNPIAWYYGSVSLSGITGLFWAPFVVWLLVVALRSERPRTLLMASALVGLVGGFRQDLTLFLVLPWLVVVLQPAWSLLHRVSAVVLLLVAVGCWLGPTIANCGGLSAYLEASAYLGDIVANDSVLFGGSLERSLATIHRLIIAIILANGVSSSLGLCLMPWRWHAVAGLARTRAEAYLLVLWLAPPLAFWALILFHKSAYLLPVLPGLLLVGTAALAHGKRGSRGVGAILVISVVLGNVLYFALPSVDTLYRQGNGFHRPHASASFASRAARQWLQSTYASLCDEDDRVRSTNAAIADLARSTPSLAIAVLPNSPYDLRVAMWSFPDLAIYELEGQPGRWARISRAQAGLWHDLPPDQPLAIGEVDQVVWVASHDEEIAATLIRQGGVLLEFGPNVKLVVTDAGIFKL